MGVFETLLLVFLPGIHHQYTDIVVAPKADTSVNLYLRNVDIEEADRIISFRSLGVDYGVSFGATLLTFIGSCFHSNASVVGMSEFPVKPDVGQTFFFQHNFGERQLID